MRKEEIRFQRNDGFKIYGCVWKPEREPIGVLQIIHGMTEYIDRYEEFASYFTDLGYIVCGFDLESHGDSKHTNTQGLYMEQWDDLVSDIEVFRAKIHRKYVDIPYAMMGFSLGSFLLRTHQCMYPKTADKLIYIGTGQPKTTGLRVASGMVNMVCKNKQKPSKFVKKLAFDNYNRKFNHAKSSVEWLLMDNEAQKRYLTDKRIVMDLTPAFFLQFLQGMIKVNEMEQWLHYKGEVLFLEGEEDPVSNGAKKVVNKYIRSGANITRYVLYDYRHDILHDGCRETVFQMIEEFLRK